MTLTRRSLLAAPLVLASSRAFASRPYDVALVLATDVSHSITRDEYEVQRQGIVNALTHRNMLLLLEQGRRYVFQYLEWSGPWTHKLSGWHVIETIDDAMAFASVIYSWERSSREGITAIGEALKTAQAAFGDAPPAIKHVIDLSFDGTDNYGKAEDLRLTSDAIAAAGTVINGLPLSEREGEGNPLTLEDYFRTYIAGPQSFSVLVPEPQHFGAMFLRKLLQEVS